MTISSETRKAGPFPGNGVTTAFPFAFKVFLAADLAVTLNVLATGVQTLLTLTSDYTVALNPDQNANPGGTVTYNPSGVPMPSTKTLTIGSVLTNTQGYEPTNGGAWLPSNAENAWDRAVILIQQAAEKVARSLKFPIVDGALIAELPPAAQRANNLLSFDASGNVVAVAPAAQSATALQTLLALFSGSSLIGWIQSGAGAILRLVQDKLRESVSVFDFMTAAQIADVKSGNQALDHTTAVAAAITYANSLGVGNAQFAVLKFPPGAYSITPGVLPPILCDIDGPRAALVANSNAAADLIRIGVATGISYNNSQKISLYSLTGYAFTYSFSGTRYGYGLGFAAAAGQFIPQLRVDIVFIQGFNIGIHADCSAGFHIGTNIFNIQTLWYCGSGIYSVCQNLEFENNIFNIVYTVGCNPTVYSSSVGTAHNCQNTYNIACLELHQIVGTTGFSLAGANTNQNIFNVASLSYNGNTTWIVNTDGLAWGNEYILPGVDVTKLTFANDILKSEGISPLNPSANNTRSIMYGASPAQNYPRRAGDRYIVNNPTAYGPASYVYSSGAWTVETFSGNVGVTAWTPTITATSGTFTTVSAIGSYSIMNGVCSFQVSITITTNGTAAGQVIATLPVSPTRVSAVCGRGDSVSGKQLQGKVFVGGSVNIANYDGTYPGANGELLIVSGQYYVN